MGIDCHIDESGWLKGARKLRSPNSDARPEDTVPDLLVIHNISLPPEQFGGPFIEQLFTNCLDADQHPYFAEIADLKVSSHILIDREGKLLQFVSLNDRAWHAGESSWQERETCNDFSIGIELEGSDNQPFTDTQYNVLVKVTEAIQGRYSGISEQRIVGHSDIAPERKTDPGPHFEWREYLAALNK